MGENKRLYLINASFKKRNLINGNLLAGVSESQQEEFISVITKAAKYTPLVLEQ